MLVPILLVPRLLELVDAAGKAILDARGRGVPAREKADGSPVTAADRAAERVVTAGLAALTETMPVVAEEAFADGATPEVGDGPFWLVDPLDGTREFVAGRDEFTVNVALVVDARPVLGIVSAPALGVTWWGAHGQGACVRRDGAVAAIRARATPAEGAVACVSRSHPDPRVDTFLAERSIARRVDAGSSLKFCLIAEGVADLYPRYGRTMEWDTAAGQAVLEAAGGAVSTLDGRPLGYRKPGWANPPFVARGA